MMCADGFGEHVKVFVEMTDRILDRSREAVKLELEIAAAESHFEAAAAHHVKHADFLRKTNGIIGGQDVNTGSQTNPFCRERKGG